MFIVAEFPIPPLKALTADINCNIEESRIALQLKAVSNQQLFIYSCSVMFCNTSDYKEV